MSFVYCLFFVAFVRFVVLVACRSLICFRIFVPRCAMFNIRGLLFVVCCALLVARCLLFVLFVGSCCLFVSWCFV